MTAAEASAQVTISNTTYTNTQTINSTSTITTSGTVAVNSGANITFRATNGISFGAGFKIASGGLFRARVGIDTDGDGLPDQWELTYGFNPDSPADAGQDADSDGLTNLLEFRLGTNPTGSSSNPTGTTELKVHKPN